MTRFGFQEAEIRRLVTGARGRGMRAPDDADAVREIDAFSRAAWSMLCEPGDRAAGLLVAALGPADALDDVIAGMDPAAISEQVDPAQSADRGALHREFTDAMQRWRPRLRSADLVIALQSAERVGAQLLLPDDPLWPTGVDDLGAHAPLALWVRGTATALIGLDRSIALVGARAATGYGEQIATDAASGLAERGLTIVSGAAYGIDGMAHRSAIATGGLTVAFLAGGVDRFYPAGHDELLGRIASVGAVISELPCGSQPTKWRFLQRNRLIAAASQATVVLEAGWRSGSLNTAGHAAAIGRALGAVPGPITSVASAGCHRLIRDYGAVCVTSVEEMMELLPDAVAAEPAAAQGGAGEPTSDELRVLDALSSRSQRGVEEIARRAGLSVPAVIAVIGGLELGGAVSRLESGWRRGP